MADPIDPKLQASVTDALKETGEALKENVRLNGDFNGIVRDTVKDLSKSVAEYERIAIRLEQLSSLHLNLKEIQKKQLELQYKSNSASREAERAFQKLGKRQAAILEYEKQILVKRDLTLDYQKALASLDDTAIFDAGKKLSLQDDLLRTYNETLDIEQLQAIAARAKQKLYAQANKESKQILQNEREVHKAIGLSGKAVEVFAKKLGVGEQVYSSMINKARELQKENAEAYLARYGAGGNKGKQYGGGIGFRQSFGVAGAGASSFISSLWKGSSGLEKLLGVGGLIYMGLKAIWGFIVEINDRIVKFRRNLGLTVEESRKMVTNFQKFSNAGGSILTTTKALMEAQTQFSQQTGITNELSGEILNNYILLNKVVGLTAEEQAGITSASIINATNQKDIIDSMSGQFESIKKISGIGFNFKNILKETSKLSGYLGLQFAKYPTDLAKSLAVIKVLGQDINKLNSQAGTLLDFESSITGEIEAQLLSGRSITLAKARELALNNDLAGMAIEISRQFGSSAEFLRMNRVAAESFAKSIGMTRDEMSEMLKQQDVLNKLGLKAGASAGDQLKAAKELYKTQKGINAALGEGTMERLTELTIQERLTGLMDKVKDAFASFFMNSGLLTRLEELIKEWTKPDNVKKLVGYVVEVANSIYKMFAGIAFVLGKIASALTFGDTTAIDRFTSGAEAEWKKNLVGDILPSFDTGGTVARGGVGMLHPAEKVVTPDEFSQLTKAVNEMKTAIVALSNKNQNISLQIDGREIALASVWNQPLSPSTNENRWT
jgi:hypothetical protein